MYTCTLVLGVTGCSVAFHTEKGRRMPLNHVLVFQTLTSPGGGVDQQAEGGRYNVLTVTPVSVSKHKGYRP